MADLKEFFKGCYTISIDSKDNRCKKKVFPKTSECYDSANNCEDLYDSYHKVCDEVWKGKCDENLSYNKNIDTLRKARKCSQLRVHFQENCVEEKCRDLAHKGADIKMRRLEGKCRKILNKR